MPVRERILRVQVDAVGRVGGDLIRRRVLEGRRVGPQELLLLCRLPLDIVQPSVEVAAANPAIVGEVVVRVQTQGHRLGKAVVSSSPELNTALASAITTASASATATATATAGQSLSATAEVHEVAPCEARLVHVVRVPEQRELCGRRKTIDVERFVVPGAAVRLGFDHRGRLESAPEPANSLAEVTSPGILAELEVDRSLLLAVGDAGELGHVGLFVIDLNALDGICREVSRRDRRVTTEKLLPIDQDVPDLLALRPDGPVGIHLDPRQPSEQLFDRGVRARHEGPRVVVECVTSVHERDVVHADHERIHLDGQHLQLDRPRVDVRRGDGKCSTHRLMTDHCDLEEVLSGGHPAQRE